MKPFTLVNYGKMYLFVIDERNRGRNHNTSYSSKLTNRRNKLECLDLPSLFSFVLCNTKLLDQFVSCEENEVL